MRHAIDTLRVPGRSLLLASGLLVIQWAFCLAVSAQHQTDTFSPVYSGDTLPYSIMARNYDFGAAELPTLHSYAAAEYDGKWVFLAGRTNGLHGFANMGSVNFPEASQNREVWVIDPVQKQAWSRSLEESGSGVSATELASLTPTNNQFFQRGDRLYMTGGYGTTAGGGFDTHSVLSALDLPGLMDWTMTGAGQAADHIRQLDDPLFKVTGGAMYEMDGRVHMVFGQDFQGAYRPGREGIYTRQVRSFDLLDDGTSLSVANVSSTVPEDAYRRRDLNVVPVMEADGNGGTREALLALSGVFTESSGSWTVPVEIAADGTPSMEDPAVAETFKQAMNQYHSAKLGLFSTQSGEMHEILLGGITVHTVDPATGSLLRDDGLPFTSQMTSVVINGAGNYQQHYVGEFPELLDMDGNRLLFGTNAEFLPAEGVAAFGNGVLDLDAITEPTVVGYVFGGIVSNAPHVRGNPDGISGASDTVFEIVVTPRSGLCDFNRDGNCDLQDLNQLLAAGDLVDGVTVDPLINRALDLTGDGLIDTSDLDLWLADAADLNGLASAYRYGDANLDGVVDVTDFNLWNTGKFSALGQWDAGDFNGDGFTDVSDFNQWNSNKFTSSGGMVPEPSSGLLAIVLALLSLGYRRVG